jgi:hypothetical protein
MDIRVGKKTGKHYLVLGEKAYLLEPEGSDAYEADCRLTGRQLGFAYDGTHGYVMRAYVEACESLNIPLYYSWQGITNSMEDHSNVNPPWKPQSLSRLKFRT